MGVWVLQRWVFRSLFLLSCAMTLPFEPFSSFYSLPTTHLTPLESAVTKKGGEGPASPLQPTDFPAGA